VLRQIPSVDELRIPDPISPAEDGIDDPFGPQNAESARAEVSIALSALDWVF
jgi:hypothetical protein